MSKIFGKVLQIIGVAMFVLVPGAGSIWLTLASSFMVGGAVLDASVQRKRAKRAMAQMLAEAQSQIVMVKQSIVARRIVYGRTRVGGIWTYVTNSTDNTYLHLVLTLCDGPVKAIPEIYFDDQIVNLDGNNEGTDKWAGNVRINKHLGATDQAADSDLVNESTEWTTDHRLRGVAYIYVRLKPDPNIFPNGLPNISAVVEGTNTVVDPRDDPQTPKYSTNVAVCLAHYMSLSRIGPNVNWSNEIDQTALIAAANVCDEDVTLEATGTFTVQFATDPNQINPTTQPHGLFNSQIVRFTTTGTLPTGLLTDTDYYVVNATKDTFEVSLTVDGTPVALTGNGSGVHTYTAKEHRYSVNGLISLDSSPEEIMNLFKEAFAGDVCYIGGKWSMYAGAYQTPTFTVDEDVLAGPIVFKPRRSKRDRYNTVKGFFMNHQNRWNPADYPPVFNQTYVDADGEELIQGLDLPMTATPTMANRIAKILLERGRMERSMKLKCNLKALRAQAGRTVFVDLPRYSINDQAFKVDGWSLEPNNGNLEITLQLTQESSSNYSWTSGSDEQSFVIPVDPVLSDGRASTPTGFQANATSGGRELVEVMLTWDATTDEYILKGGLVIVEWKKSTDTDYQSITGSPLSVEYPVKGLVPSTSYDFRIAWRNKFGGQSDWATATETTAASTNSAFAYTHTQAVPATTWTITHNFGYRPSQILVFNGDNVPVYGYQKKGSAGDPTGLFEIEVTFKSAISGVAYLS